jgi:hypothetical protein
VPRSGLSCWDLPTTPGSAAAANARSVVSTTGPSGRSGTYLFSMRIWYWWCGGPGLLAQHAMDMSPTFESVVREHCPNAEIVLEGHPLALPLEPEHQHPGADQQQDQGPQADRLRLPGRGLLLPQDPCGLSR